MSGIGADDAQDGAVEHEHESVRRGDARGEEGHRQGHGAADRRRDDRHLEGLEHRLDRPRQEGPVRVQELRDDVGATGGVGEDRPDVEADAELLADRQRGDDDERDDARRHGERTRAACGSVCALAVALTSERVGASARP